MRNFGPTFKNMLNFKPVVYITPLIISTYKHRDQHHGLLAVFITLFSGVSNFLRRSFYKLCFRKELLCYYWNQFGGRVHFGGRRCFRGYSIYWTNDINCGSKCVCKILKNIFIIEISLCGNKLFRFTFCFQLITT